MFIPVTDHIYMISGNNQGHFPSSFCFYIDDKQKVLIDTPLDREFPNLLGDRKVDLIINSHFHRDHTGCNDLFPQARIMAHPLDIPPMESLNVFCYHYGFDNYGTKELQQGLVKWLGYQPCTVDQAIEDGDIIELGKNKLEVIHTPGHTPGHCAFFERESGILFSGDIDLTSFGPWYGNLTSDVDDIIESINKIIQLNPRIILSSHKGIVDHNVSGRLQKYLQKVYQNENRILETLRRPTNLDTLTQKKLIYGKWHEPYIVYEFFEQLSLIVHLRRLLKLGTVKQIGDKYVSMVSNCGSCNA